MGEILEITGIWGEIDNNLINIYQGWNLTSLAALIQLSLKNENCRTQLTNISRFNLLM